MPIPLDTRIVIGPNASMTPALAASFLAATAVVSFGIAGGLAAMGYWPVVPFAGLEVGALAVALAVMLRRNRYCEVIAFDAERIRIEFGTAGVGVERAAELPRAWARVLLDAGPHRLSPTRLSLASHGRRVVIGQCLTDEERERLARRLRQLTGPAWMWSQGRTSPASMPAQEHQ